MSDDAGVSRGAPRVERTSSGDDDWPTVAVERLRWTPRTDEWSAVSRRARRSGTYEASVPSFIASRHVALDSETTALADDASVSLTRFDASLAGEVAAFEPLLLRSEAAASSRIEQLTASARAILTAEFTGHSRSSNALTIVGNTRAMSAAIALADQLSVDAVLEMHRVLMSGDESHTPGRFRTEAVWIGRSSLSPIGADFVAPAFERVPRLVDDVMSFAARSDIPVLTQAALTHAQFETIHPFTDGNGRTGRALLQAMLRAGDLTRSVTVPVSAGLLANVDAYHRALTDYRSGNPSPIVRLTAEAAIRAIENATDLVEDLRRIREDWSAGVRVRSDSTANRVLDLAIRQPVFTAATVASELGVSPTNVYRAVRPLVDAGVVVPEVLSRAGTIWRADAVLRALDGFAERAGRRSRPGRSS